MTRSLVRGVLCLFFLLFVAAPMTNLALTVFMPKPPPILDHVARLDLTSLVEEAAEKGSFRALRDLGQIRRYRRAAVNTLWLSFLVATLCCVLALPLSLGFARRLLSSRSPVGTVVLMPLALHSYLFAFSIILIFGKQGLCERFLGFSPVDPFSVTGLVITQTVAFLPLAILAQAPSLALYSSGWTAVSRTMGAPWSFYLRHIWLPLNLRGILAGWLLVAIRSASDFVSPMLLTSTRFRLLVLEAWRDLAGSNWWPGAAALSMEILVICGFFMLIERTLSGRAYAQIDAGDPGNLEAGSRRGTWLLRAYTALMMALPFFCMLTIIGFSVGGLSNTGFSFAHYQEVADDLFKGLTVSLTLGAAVTGFCLLAALAIAPVDSRRAGPAKRWVLFWAQAAFAIPSTIYAIGLVSVFNRPPLFLHFTPALLIAALAATRMNYALNIMGASWDALGSDWNDRASASGASALFAFRWATFPFLRGAMASGAALIFISALQDVAISILIAPPRFYPLSLVMTRNIADGLFGTASALAVSLMLVLTVPLFLSLNLLSSAGLFERGHHDQRHPAG
ncbi:MAG: iron ABC transporter permease [Elusimicrobia bacterium]|nr:iron ABC transporter permease [Elusimicrobiota bacterium]